MYKLNLTPRLSKFLILHDVRSKLISIYDWHEPRIWSRWIGARERSAERTAQFRPETSRTQIRTKFKRYKRGLETCQQANLHQSGREYFLLFFSDAATLVQIRLYRLILNPSVYQNCDNNKYFMLLSITKT